ncbi:hypothetical protein PIB30_061669 [Stylosanthes scabra]|uniref:Transmembrane protein n=1 Tax=Stylosanthes scabra TaxID=79078 RepID=A0ABU6UPJ3_9FABA|nr:hypothetical protein [Stylosanthes scabra]
MGWYLRIKEGKWTGRWDKNKQRTKKSISPVVELGMDYFGGGVLNGVGHYESGKKGNFRICTPGNTKECFESWMEVRVVKEMRSIWMVVLFAVTWCIWQVRNEIIFKNGVWDVEVLKGEIIRKSTTWNREWEERRNDRARGRA